MWCNERSSLCVFVNIQFILNKHHIKLYSTAGFSKPWPTGSILSSTLLHFGNSYFVTYFVYSFTVVCEPFHAAKAKLSSYDRGYTLCKWCCNEHPYVSLSAHEWVFSCSRCQPLEMILPYSMVFIRIPWVSNLLTS